MGHLDGEKSPKHADLRVLATVRIGKGPGFPIFSPDNTKLYVMLSAMGDVAVVDLNTMSVTARHKVGKDPFGGGLLRRAGKSPSP